jgi:parallel beta-helix repeat protein
MKRMKKITNLRILTVMIIITFIYGFPNDRSKSFVNDDSFVTHAPIVIDGNEDLLKQGERNDWQGNGLKNDPIKIVNLNFSAEGDEWLTFISISNTDLFIEIQDCSFKGQKVRESWSIGNPLEINNVKNLKFNKNHLVDSNYGLTVINSQFIEISKNSILNSWEEGIISYSSQNISIVNNTISNGIGGYPVGVVHIENSSNASIINNRISQGYAGVFLDSSDYTIIEDNDIFKNDNGIYLSNSSENVISKNLFYNNSAGLMIKNGINSLILNNTFQDNCLANEFKDKNINTTFNFNIFGEKDCNQNQNDNNNDYDYFGYAYNRIFDINIFHAFGFLSGILVLGILVLIKRKKRIKLNEVK